MVWCAEHESGDYPRIFSLIRSNNQGQRSMSAKFLFFHKKMFYFGEKANNEVFLKQFGVLNINLVLNAG